MTQKNFQPEDFSPIHYYPEVPDKKGWYVATWDMLEGLHRGEFLIEEGKHGMDFRYWNGEEWCTDDSGKFYSKATTQKRDWFGLNHEPKSGV